MPIFIVIPALVFVAWVLLNIGAKERTPLSKIALPIVIAGVLVYLAGPALTPLANWLMQVGHGLVAH